MATITFPSPARIKAIQWSLDRPAQISVSGYTGRRKVVANPWHGKWTASVELAAMDVAAARSWRSFLAALKGQINNFKLPASEEVAQNANSGVTVSVAGVQGATSFTITGAATAMLVGQMMTVNDQLLMITGVTGSTLTFEPPLRAAAAVGAAVETSRPYALMAMSSSTYSWSADLGPIYSFAFDAEESIGETAVVAFNPATLFSSGQAGGWYDPSDLSSMWQDSAGTIAAAVDSPVGKIDDKSGRGNHLVQATSAARPILRLATGYYYLEFDGVDDLLDKTLGTAIAQPYSRVSSLRQVSWASNDYIFTGATSAAGGLIQLGASPELQIYAGTAFVASNTNLAVGVNGVVSEAFNGASSSLTINNGTATTGNPGSASATNIAVGALSGGSFYSNVRIYGHLVRAGTFTSQELSDLRTYMAGKAGVTL